MGASSSLSASTLQSSSQQVGSDTVVSFLVTAQGSEIIKDFHVWVVGGKPMGTPDDMPKAGQPTASVAGWAGSRSSGGVNWKCSQQSGFITAAQNNPAVFSIRVPTSKFVSGEVRWATTSDGDFSRTNSEPISEGSCAGPVVTRSITGGQLFVGQTTSLAVSTNLHGATYRVYAVDADPTAAPSSMENYAGFMSWIAQHEVPSSAGFTFQGLVGTTGASNGVAQFFATVPSNPALIGTSVWFIGLVDDDADDDSVVDHVSTPGVVRVVQSQ